MKLREMLAPPVSDRAWLKQRLLEIGRARMEEARTTHAPKREPRTAEQLLPSLVVYGMVAELSVDQIASVAAAVEWLEFSGRVEDFLLRWEHPKVEEPPNARLSVGGDYSSITLMLSHMDYSDSVSTPLFVAGKEVTLVHPVSLAPTWHDIAVAEGPGLWNSLLECATSGLEREKALLKFPIPTVSISMLIGGMCCEKIVVPLDWATPEVRATLNAIKEVLHGAV